MKHDFRSHPSGDAAQRFSSWLELETIDSLRRSHRNLDATKGAIFLFVNRAYESHMPEAQIAEMFGRSIVRAGFSEEDEEFAFSILEELAQIAANVHRT